MEGVSMFQYTKHRKVLLIYLILLLCFILVSISPQVYATENETNISVYPTPKNMDVKKGLRFPLTPKVGVVVPNEYDPTVLKELEQVLKSFNVKKIQKFTPHDKVTTPVTIYLSSNLKAPYIVTQLNTLDIEPQSYPAEGYLLASGKGNDGKKKIIIAGEDWDGTYYGVKTLKQIIEQNSGRASVPELVVEDYPEMEYRGVIEGFYGTPWSHEERVDQLKFYGDNKMNTYVYAPKDDPYHRDAWRGPYPTGKLNELAELVDIAKKNHIDFVFTISPGLDICYSDNQDFNLLFEKAQALYDVGVRDFAILFDDIFMEMSCKMDEKMFGDEPSPTAAAQAFLLNKFQDKFIEKNEGTNRLITVPTEYYQEGTSPYREQFADLVDSSVLVYWTGIGITTDTITNEDAQRISDIFKHDLLIWDNYPVNDFSEYRIFLGPLTGRDAGLTEHGVHGLTANPMEHAEASKIPLFTIADYTWNPKDYTSKDSWDASINDFTGSYTEEVTTFAENVLSSPLNQSESRTIKPIIDKFWEGFNGRNDFQEIASNLYNEFFILENSADTLEEDFTNREFIKEMNPWIDKMRHYGISGKLAVQMVRANYNGDTELAEKYKNLLEYELEHDTTDVVYREDQIASRQLDGINKERGWAEFVMYTPEYGESTQTNQWGFEITVIDGEVTDVGGNNSTIPSDGYVLSLHSGGDGDWLANNSIVGASSSISENIVTLEIEKGEYDIPNEAKYGFNVFEPFINQALKVVD
ncbi:beta-N-acetylhexosaminidase [Virgibacillus massiliensis]|nr:beta-N-acetylhexosaminidase [Virgibacillus massiliensis]